VTVVLRGALDVQTMGGLWRELEARLRPLKAAALEVDATALRLCGGGGLALLRFLKTGGFTPMANVTVRGLGEDLDQLLWLFADEDSEAAPTQRRRTPSLPEEIGTSVHAFVRDFREQVAFLAYPVG
jgi:ABC-type transporter Mla MlaB component